MENVDLNKKLISHETWIRYRTMRYYELVGILDDALGLDESLSKEELIKKLRELKNQLGCRTSESKVYLMKNKHKIIIPVFEK